MKKPQTFKALLFEPGKPAEVREVPATVEGMQSLIGGGYVERVVQLDRDLWLYADEEGLLRGLPRNLTVPGGTWIVGPAFIARSRGENFADVTDADVAFWRERFGRA